MEHVGRGQETRTERLAVLGASVVLLGLLLVLPGAARAQAYPPGMISYWKFDQGSGAIAYDSVGPNNGTLSNGPVWTTGQVDGALEFDGVDDYVEIPDADNLDVSTTFTLSAWVKTTSGGAIISKASWCPNASVPYKGSSYLLTWSGEGAYLMINQDGNFYHLHGALHGNALVNDGDFHLVSATFDNSRAEIYLDGTLDSSAVLEIDTNDPEAEFIDAGDCVAYRKGPVDISWCGYPGINYTGLLRVDHAYIGGESVRIGSNWSYCSYVGIPDGPLTGTIDEVAIYNRALTQDEIQNHYQNGLNGRGYELAAVGGIAELPNVSDSSAPNHIALGGIAAVALVALTAGGWYARRRWGRQPPC